MSEIAIKSRFCFPLDNNSTHFAALNNVYCEKQPKDAFDINAFGTENLLKEAVSVNVPKFIYFSVSQLYGQVKAEKIHEEIAVHPTNIYSITHRLAEMFCFKYAKDYGILAISFRLTNVYGSPKHHLIDRWTLVINDLCRQAFVKKCVELFSSGKQKRDFIAISDIFQAVQLIIEQPDDQIQYPLYNLGGEQIFSIREIAEIIHEEYIHQYQEGIPLIIPTDDDTTQTVQPPYLFDIERIKAIGYQPKGNLRAEIRKTLKLCERFAQ